MNTFTLMKNFLLLFYSLLFSAYGFGQNLVPNPSFEDTVTCPTALTQISNAIGWSSYRQSPDYFNICSSSSTVSIPENVWGFQYPKEGDAYAAFIAFSLTAVNTREYLGIQLLQPLSIGQKYFVSFFVSPGRGYNNLYYPDLACNKIGIQLSTIPFSTVTWQPISNSSFVFADSIIRDTINWTRIDGAFIADSSYQYLSIGNFFVDSLTSYIVFDSNLSVAIYYLDDIRLSTDSNFVYGLPELPTHSSQINLFPNPTHNSFTVHCPHLIDNRVLTIFNSLGQVVFQTTITNQSTVINHGLGAGVYFVASGTSRTSVTAPATGAVQKLIVY
jgi:hypothetical protein